MPSLLKSFSGLLKDPPPAYAFELSAGHMAVARTHKGPELQLRQLEPDTIAVSPLRDNVLRPEALAAQIRAAVPPNGGRKRRTAALILPDYCVRVAVLDFDAFPSDPKEQLSLIRFRLKKTLPFDVESAALGYHVQHGAGGKRVDVAVAVAPLEIIARYEAPFRACNLHVGMVTTSALAAFELVPPVGAKLLVKRTGPILSIAASQAGVLKLVRSLELSDSSLDEMLGHLHPTLAFVEDQLGARPAVLLLCGFGSSFQEAQLRLAVELDLPVEPLQSRFGPAGEFNAGLLGYLESLKEF